MINPEELRKGNLISNGHITDTVQGFYKDHTNTWNVYVSRVRLGKIWDSVQELNKFNAIPLTEEWLLTFGFKKTIIQWSDSSTSYGGTKEEYYEKEGYGVIKHDSWSFSRVYFNGQRPESIKLKITYVHQLQNLYFALTDIELQIK